jgi:hypothetical protein
MIYGLERMKSKMLQLACVNAEGHGIAKTNSEIDYQGKTISLGEKSFTNH